MSENRHWLTRDLPTGEYSISINPVAPKLKKSGWHAGDGGMWRSVERHLKPGPDGLVYGQKLEPGGGPVDVSQWFPEGGKDCHNCGHMWSPQGYTQKCPYAPCGAPPMHWIPAAPETVAPTESEAEPVVNRGDRRCQTCKWDVAVCSLDAPGRPCIDCLSYDQWRPKEPESWHGFTKGDRVLLYRGHFAEPSTRGSVVGGSAASLYVKCDDGRVGEGPNGSWIATPRWAECIPVESEGK